MASSGSLDSLAGDYDAKANYKLVKLIAGPTNPSVVGAQNRLHSTVNKTQENEDEYFSVSAENSNSGNAPLENTNKGKTGALISKTFAKKPLK